MLAQAAPDMFNRFEQVLDCGAHDEPEVALTILMYAAQVNDELMFVHPLTAGEICDFFQNSARKYGLMDTSFLKKLVAAANKPFNAKYVCDKIGIDCPVSNTLQTTVVRFLTFIRPCSSILDDLFSMYMPDDVETMSVMNTLIDQYAQGDKSEAEKIAIQECLGAFLHHVNSKVKQEFFQNHAQHRDFLEFCIQNYYIE
jgi:hypothetical protein